MSQDQEFKSVSPPKDVISTQSPIFSFTDPRHSPAFVQRMRNARPDPSQFKIKLFKVQMDIPGVEEALNPVNPLGHMKRIGLSMAAMSFLSPNKCKIEEKQNEQSKINQDKEETHEDQPAIDESKHQFNGGADYAQNKDTQNNEIPLLPANVLSQSKWGQSQSPQHNEDFYSPSEYRKKIQDNLLRDESIRQDDLGCTENTQQDQRSSIFSQTDQRYSLLTSSEQRTSQQSQYQQRTSLLSQNNQSKNFVSEQQSDERPSLQNEISENFKENDEMLSSLKIEQQNESKLRNTTTVDDQFNTKQDFPKIIKEHFGSMLLPSEGNNEMFKEEEEEQDQVYVSFSKKWVSKHHKHNNYSIDTPSFNHMSHTTHTLPSFSFSESISGGNESNTIVQHMRTLNENNSKENEGNNTNNTLFNYLSYGQQKAKQTEIVNKITLDAFHRKSEDISTSTIILSNNQQNNVYDNKYSEYNSLAKNISDNSNPMFKDQSISNVQHQFPQYIPPNSQILEVNPVQISSDKNKNNNTTNIIDVKYGNNIIHNDMPYERIEQIIEDSLKRTSALFEQIKEENVKSALNKINIKPQETILSLDAQKQQISSTLNTGNHQYLRENQTSVKNQHSLNTCKPVDQQAYLGELLQKQQPSQSRKESNPSNNLNQQNQNPLHVEQIFSAPQVNIKDEGSQNLLLVDNSSIKSQYLHSYDLKENSSRNDASVVCQRSLPVLDPSKILDSNSNTPHTHHIQDQKQISNEAQFYHKTTNKTSSSSSNWRNFSHLSSSVDYSISRKLPLAYAPYNFNVPVQSEAVNNSYSSANTQYLQTQGQDSHISLKQQLLSNQIEPSGQSQFNKIHSHSLSPAPTQYLNFNLRSNHEETTEKNKQNSFQHSFQDNNRFHLTQQNEEKVISIPSPFNKTIPSATVNLSFLSQKYSSNNAPLTGNKQQ